MLFNSIDFAIFLPIVFFLYWFVTYKNLRLQNLLIVVASYVFYGWWDWRFLSLIAFSTVVDFALGLALKDESSPAKRKLLLWTSILVNLSFLGFFKYYNFFLDNFVHAFSLFGMEIRANSLNVILPVGISFYTFQSLSYVVDVYKRKLEPTTSLIEFTAFVSFFPQLVAGPIERATNLLPQVRRQRGFDYTKAVDGMRQILWGLFKKIVIADNCADFANQVFGQSEAMNGSALALGAVFFAFQIYGDFSGYSDIAIGTARLFGFNLMQNFAYPYFSRDIAEFWRRWHISLSTWFRDYLYFPLGGSRGTTQNKVRNVFIVFIASGFWHGASWTFLAWGALNAIYFLPLVLTRKNRDNIGIVAQGKRLPSMKEFVLMLLTFGLTVFAWIFFRAENLGHAFSYISGIISPSLFEIPNFSFGLRRPLLISIIAVFMFSLEWFGREKQFALQNLCHRWKWPIRYAVYYTIIILIFSFGGKEQQFIYFQF